MRESLLVFQGIDGIKGVYHTEGTFDRATFISKCIAFASTEGLVHKYPGRYSVWIMDGASIHCDPNVVAALLSMGIIVFFLPAYCPFFNPIEVFFSMLKAKFKNIYNMYDNNSVLHIIAAAVADFRHYNFREIFSHCGYTEHGFNPVPGLTLHQ